MARGVITLFGYYLDSYVIGREDVETSEMYDASQKIFEELMKHGGVTGIDSAEDVYRGARAITLKGVGGNLLAVEIVGKRVGYIPAKNLILV